MIAWCVQSLSFGVTLPGKWVVIGFLMGWFAVFLHTFPRHPFLKGRGLLSDEFPFDPLDVEPVLMVTPGRIRFARWVLLGLAANALLWLGVSFAFKKPETVDRRMTMVLTSWMVLNLVYMAMHWGFRPQHLFAHTRLEWVLGRGWRDLIRHRELEARRDERRSEYERLVELIGSKAARETMKNRRRSERPPSKFEPGV